MRVARLTRYINGPLPYASIPCRPSARSSKGILHKIQGSKEIFGQAQGSSVDSSMILLCFFKYIYRVCIRNC